jgi:diaminopimelate epimerase
MKKNLKFVKYTSNGNNFVIVDETEAEYFSENEKKIFAKRATDVNFGIGCDNLIVLQKFSLKTINKINSERKYWREINIDDHAQFIFRMLEPDGNEALSCGNGLLCIANYLFIKYNIKKTKIWTEIPSIKPTIIELGTDSISKKSFVNMGAARRVGDNLVNRSAVECISDEVDKINNLKIVFRSNDLNFDSNITEINLNGYLVFTGEPHLVLFVDNAFSIDSIKNFFFIKNKKLKKLTKIHERRGNFGKWLVNHIGFFLNNKSREIFPSGINVNFARIVNKNLGIIDYRTYERGINHETLSCGTGAIAVAHVAKQLKLIKKII